MTTTANGKTVLVTGGSRGIGAAIAKQLAGIGMNVVINYASNEGAANEVVRSITAAGGVALKATYRSPTNLPTCLTKPN